MKIATITALVAVLATAVPAMIWIGALQEKVDQLQHEVATCASREVQQTHDSWMKSWSDEINYRLRRLEEKR